MAKTIGILTIGGDCPGINAAIRGIGKACQGTYGIKTIGFQDGFSGMANDLTVPMEGEALSGILTLGGTILGINRDRPNAVPEGGKLVDRTREVIEVYKKHKLDALVCLGGTDAQESAFYLMQQGLNVITLPLTIDNDIPESDTSVGFSTAVEVAAEAIDRLHSTAISHHRIIIVEVMGRETGWLTLAAGLAGGADVILIPEIPYDIQSVGNAILERSKKGKRFSLVAVSEGAISKDTVQFFDTARRANKSMHQGDQVNQVATKLNQLEKQSAGDTLHLANRLEHITQLETRITILGYLQRGGTPSATDRVLATQLGTACASHIHENHFGIMVAPSSCGIDTVPLENIAGKVKHVPLNHTWVNGARLVGVSLGD